MEALLWINALTYSFNKYLLITYYLLGPCQSHDNTVNIIDMGPNLHEA